MRAAPFGTPQTFSRIVVLPAFALPMIRIRKQGHLARSLSKAAVPLSTTSVAHERRIRSGSGDREWDVCFDILPNECPDVREVGVSAITRITKGTSSSGIEYEGCQGRMDAGGNLIYGFGNFHIRAREAEQQYV